MLVRSFIVDGVGRVSQQCSNAVMADRAECMVRDKLRVSAAINSDILQVDEVIILTSR